MLTVIVPAFNEASTIAAVLRRVDGVDLDMEIIVVDDGSTDGTLDQVEAAGVGSVRVLRHDVNQGKGAAVRTGLAQATGDVIVIQDGDMEYDPLDFVRLYEPIASGETRVVYGFREFSSQTGLLRAGNRFVTFLTNILYGIAIRDMETCYKMWQRRVLEDVELSASGFDIEVELTAAFVAAGERIVQLPINYQARQAKKLRWWLDGPVAILRLVQYRFFR
jgi:glycosyltransferase involved in cell wall biosynthesis